jgi:hypothetical protein
MNEEQIKSRLINISKEEKRTFNDLLKQLAFERMLARVASSTHRDQLIFKGGLPTGIYIFRKITGHY